MEGVIPRRLQILTSKLREDRIKALAANAVKKKEEESKRRLKAQECSQNKKAAEEAKKLNITSRQQHVSVTVMVNVKDNKKRDKVVSIKSQPAHRKTTKNYNKKRVEVVPIKSQPVKRKATEENTQVIKNKRRKGHNPDKDMQRMKTRERVKKHRAGLSEESLTRRREKDREYRRKRKDMKLDKPISELSKREQRRTRKIWRQNSKAYRERQAALSTISVATTENDHNEFDTAEVQAERSKKKRTIKRRSQIVGKLTRKLMKTEAELMGAKSMIRHYRRKLVRMKGSTKYPTPSGSPSPATKVKKMTAGNKINPEVRKRLLFAEVLTNEIKRRASRMQKISK